MPQRVIDLYRQHVAAQEAEVAVGAPSHRGGNEAKPGGRPPTVGEPGSRDRVRQNAPYLRAERYVYQSGDPVRVVDPLSSASPCARYGVWDRPDARRWSLVLWDEYRRRSISLPPLGEEGNVEILLERLDFVAGTYYLDVAVHALDGYPYDYHHGLYSFTVKSDLQEVGVCRIPHSWAIKPLVAVP